MRSEEAVAEATRIRAARSQAVWPRVLGWAFIGVALAVALNPMTWVQPHLVVSAHGGLVPEPPGRSIAISSPHYVDAAAAFRWREGDVTGPFSLVVLAEDYLPIVQFDGIERSPFRPEEAAAAALRPGTSYSAYLLATHRGRLVKSPLTTFVWR